MSDKGQRGRRDPSDQSHRGRGQRGTTPSSVAAMGRSRGVRPIPTPASQLSPPGRQTEPSQFPTMSELEPGILTHDRYGVLPEGQETGNTRRESFARFDYVKTKVDGQIKEGIFGKPVKLVANYFPVRTGPEFGVFHYRVDFEPHLEETWERRAALKRFQAQEGNDGVLGTTIFDGHSIWTSRRYVKNIGDSFPLTSSKTDGSPVTIKIKLVKELESGSPEFLQVYNNIVRTCLRALRLTQIGRNYFDPSLEINIRSRNLVLWPGFVTTLRQHDAPELLYCVEITHKVIRTDRVLDFINGKLKDFVNMNPRQVHDIIGKEIIGSVVMTAYNKKTYRVDDILWNENPLTTFKQEDKDITIKDYMFNRYKLPVKDSQQPLLLSNRKMRDIRRGFTTPFKLIPEFCQMTGLSDSMRADFGLMKDLGQHLFQVPKAKVESITNFIRRLGDNTEVRRELSDWGMALEPNPIQFQGRSLPGETILFKNPNGNPEQFQANPDTADFTMAFRGNLMVKSVELNNWVIIVPCRDFRNVETLVNTMNRVATPLGFKIARAKEIVQLQEVRPKNYVDAITGVVGKYKDVQMIFAILPNNKIEAYSAVKKRTYVDYGLLSQCFLAKNLISKGIMSIATKVVVQMNAKLGGEPWRIAIPLKKLMVVGFDVHHGGAGSNHPSVGAMVSTTNESHARYYSVASFSRGREELSTKIASDMKRCLIAFRTSNNGSLPERIIFYRDGVGEGQLNFVVITEVESLKRMLVEYYAESGLAEPMFTFIICTKRINTRVFQPDAQGGYKNPSPGTVVDKMITLPERWDFFLISPAARQGTVAPTSYNVIHDSNKLDADKMQRLTFKMCHLYYNWSGSVAVPAVVQYAHKLAYLSGMALGVERETNERLHHLLYFL